MFVKLEAAALIGLEAAPISVEIDMSRGQGNFQIVGLPDTSIKEARERLCSAIKNSGYNYPYNHRLLVNLAPADLPKEGPLYDLPMAAALVSVAENLTMNFDNILIVGELALNGDVRRVNGVLPLAIYAKNRGIKAFFVPKDNAAEAALIKDGPQIFPVENLRELIDCLTKTKEIAPYQNENAEDKYYPDENGLDMSLVRGQTFAKRALEISAAGGHNVIMIGPPGSGKTLLARTLPSILPRLTDEESLEVTKIYSIAGLTHENIVRERPFRSPHHTISGAALVGGGKWPRPGEITLSHRGVLFLDEFPEFPRTVLEALRQPLEDGVITVSRAQGSLSFPARFMLVASQNPCPCGYADDPDHSCSCTAAQINIYRKKISGPILDRIDLHITVPRVEFSEMTSVEPAELSGAIRERVTRARENQQRRFAGKNIHLNAEMGNKELREFCQVDEQTLKLLGEAVTRMRLSARAYNRLLKVARTIADLSGSGKIALPHVAEALQYRPGENVF